MVQGVPILGNSSDLGSLIYGVKVSTTHYATLYVRVPIHRQRYLWRANR